MIKNPKFKYTCQIYPILLFVLYLTTATFLYGQNPVDGPQSYYSQKVKFETISIEQNLSQSTVRTIYQDSKGFMWFGTEDGLNKFDGFKFTVYKFNPNDINSLSSNFNKSNFRG